MMKIAQVGYVKVLSWDEVSSEDKMLFDLAIKARKNAVAERSHFRVGAAILWRRGHTSRGCNIENCVYNGLHAERGAIHDGIVHEGLDKIERVVVVAAPEAEEIVLPQPMNQFELGQIVKGIGVQDACVACGQCLQDILEFSFGNPESVILSMDFKGVVLQTTLAALLPARFGPELLGVDYAKLIQQK